MLQFLQKCMADLLAQRERWIFWVPAPVGLGIIFYFSLHHEPPVYFGGAALAAIGLLGYVRRDIRFLVPWLAVFLFALGFTAAQIRTAAVDAPVLQRETYPLTLKGRVLEVDALPKAYRIVMDGLEITRGQLWRNTLPARVRIKLKNNDPAAPRAGDIVEVRAVLLPLSAPVLPGAFDFQRHAFFKRLGGTGYAIGDLKVIAPHKEDFFFESLRHYIRTKVSENIENKDHAAIVTALLVGESKGISEKTWETIRLSGIAHLISISGYHITLVAGFVFFLVRALLAAFPHAALRWPIKKMSAVAAMGGVIFYCLLIASPIPAQRAVIMTCVVMTAIILDRDPFTLRLAAFAALVIFLLQPESVVGPSFQLSFAAVVCMISFYEATRNWWSRQVMDRAWYRRYAIYLLGCFVTTLIASAATAPYALYHFARMPTLSGLAANMIAVPISSFITMPAGVVAAFMMPLGLEKWPLWVAEKSVGIIMMTAHETASWPYAVLQVDSWPPIWLGVITFGGLWIVLWQGRVRWLGILPILLAVIAIPFTQRPDVLIADNAKLFAVRSPEDGSLWVSSLRREKFMRNEWVEREGGRGYDAWPENDYNMFLDCREGQCVYAAKGRKVGFILDPIQADRNCESADLFIVADYMDGINPCPAKKVIDKRQIRDNGAIAIYFGKEKFRIETVAEERGVRPWTGKKSKRVWP